MTKIKGMDISNYQGKVTKANFLKAQKYGIEFVILKCGYTGYSRYKCKADNAFEYNYKKAIAAGLPVGVYYYSLANGPKSITAEANFVIKQLKGKKITCPVYLDMEDSLWRMYKCSRKQLAEIANIWCRIIRKAGYTPGIYASTSWFNNKIGTITQPHTKWVAQYNNKCEYEGNYDIWQYSSSETVPGIGKRVDVNWAYKKPWKITVIEEKKPVEPVKEDKPKLTKYTGKFPTLKLEKTTQQIIDDTVAWAIMIANDNRFHYGYTNKRKGINAHHNGCYFCDTQKSNKNGILDKKYTYCCNPYVHAAWAHGGLVPSMLSICRKGSSYGFAKSEGYAKSSLFKSLGHIDKEKLKKGDVLCNDHHVALYVGDGKIAEASGGDDNKRNSRKWNKSISVKTLSNSYYKSFPRVYRFIGSYSDFKHNITLGDISIDVKRLQKYLNWYGDYRLLPDGKFMGKTSDALAYFQDKEGLKPDRVCGPATLDRMKKVKK